jgi:hypothetical protein
VVFDACGTAHAEKIDAIEAEITAKGSQADALIAQLYFDFGSDS